MILTNHIINDRMERIVYIAKKVGWGETIVTYTDTTRQVKICLTSTGVILIKNASIDRLVTAYVANIDDVKWIYTVMGYERIPERVYNKTMKNRKHLRFM